MSNIDGFYALKFSTPLGQGAGVVTLRDGKLEGGDSAILYRGDYQVADDRFTAEVQTDRHAAGMPSVLGVDKTTITISGTVSKDTNHITIVKAFAAAAPNAVLTGAMHRIH